MVYLHKKNLETLMKSRNEFTTNEEYNEYLRIYFAGLAMQGILSNQSIVKGLIFTSGDAYKIAKASIELADELLKQLEEK